MPARTDLYHHEAILVLRSFCLQDRQQVLPLILWKNYRASIPLVVPLCNRLFRPDLRWQPLVKPWSVQVLLTRVRNPGQ